MSEETKVIIEQPTVEAVIPAEIAPGVSESDKVRQAIEAQVIKENDTLPTPEPEEVAQLDAKVDVKPEVKAKSTETDAKPEETTVDKIKKSVQKRIDKEVAKRKTLEEELEDLRQENARLKSKPETEVAKDAKPTIEQCEAYIIKMREEGNVKEEIAAMRYLVQLEKEAAIESVKAEQSKQTQAQVKQQESWIELNKDYHSENPELNLLNQKGLLYTTAMSLFQDKELNSRFYNDPDKIQGFRRAVNDAYREIHEQGLLKPKAKEEIIPMIKKPTKVLAEPSSDSAEETSSPQADISDAEKVRLEVKRRKEYSNKRAAFII
jgi:hypothetical protein